MPPLSRFLPKRGGRRVPKQHGLSPAEIAAASRADHERRVAEAILLLKFPDYDDELFPAKKNVVSP